MARIKHYDPEKQEWVYSDKAFASSGGGGDYVQTEDDKRSIATMAAALVDIPTDDHINSLINAALGVIENGSY
jgi:hypothetical protein